MSSNGKKEPKDPKQPNEKTWIKVSETLKKDEKEKPEKE